MLPVYICEDNKQSRDSLKDYLEKQILMNNYDMEIVLCSGHPKKILDQIRCVPRQGIYFLDVELKGEAMDGFTLGQEIRRYDARGFLIYVTAFQDLAFETFRYHLEALDYLVKGDEKRLYEGISRCLEDITQRMCRERDEEREYFTVKVLDVVKHIPIDEILFFTTSGRTHRIELHAVRDRMDFIGSMQELEKQLPDCFMRVHRACLVNIDHIAQLDMKKREILMDNGERCIFARTMRERLVKQVQS